MKQLIDGCGRCINYLRISVTDRCNFRCQYCMPAEGIPMKSHADMLTLEEMAEFAKTACSYGIEKVRITGGEPLVKKGILSFVGMLSRIPEIKDLAMTTNGFFLEKFAQPLKDAGLMRINVSLDTLSEGDFKAVTRCGDLSRVLQGIEAAKAAGLLPIKLNCVVKRSRDDENARQVTKYAEENGFEVRFIRLMNMERGEFWPVDGGEGGDCSICNRLRLTCDGQLKPCLFSDEFYDIRRLGHEKAIQLALKNKPASGSKSKSTFNRVGG